MSPDRPLRPGERSGPGAGRPDPGRPDPSRPLARPEMGRADPLGRSSGPGGGTGRAEPSRPPEPPKDEAPRTITKKELVARIADRTAQTKVIARDIIQMFLDEIIQELGRGNRLEFREFGVFEIKERAARKAQNPRTLEKVDVPAKRVVKFRVGRLMKQRVGAIPEGSQIADGSDDYDDDDDEE
jgi:integration host factor subunit beta